LVAYNVDTGAMRPVVLPNSAVATEVFAPRADSMSGTYVRADGSPAPGVATGGYGPAELLWCDAQLLCQARDPAWGGDYMFQTDRMDPTGLVLGSQEVAPKVQFALSVDGGATRASTMPEGGTGLNNEFSLSGPPGDVSVLVTVPDPNGAATVTRWRPDGSTQALAPIPAVAGAQQYVIVAVTQSRLIAYPHSGTVAVTGFWCSVDGGRSWQQGCSPER
jgi:hypothetical protein